MTLINSAVAVALVAFFFWSHHVCSGEEVIFYDDDGSVFTLTITGGCYTFKPKWDRRASAIDIDDGCFNFWDAPDCRGRHLTLTKGSHDLKKERFDKVITSVKLCSPEEEDRRRLQEQGGSSQTSTGTAGTSTTPGSAKPHDLGTTLSMKEIQDTAVEEHNKFRRKHGVPDLHGDPVMHDDAQKYAEYLASTNKFEPTTMGKYGTNIASSFRRNKVEAIKDAIKRWYDKHKFYDYNRPGYNMGGQSTGSFTAMVWKATTQMGIGIAFNEVEEQWIIVAFYGNDEDIPPHAEASSGKTSCLLGHNGGYRLFFTVIFPLLIFLKV